MTSSPHERAAAYEDRYCAFIDILGFRNLVRGLHSSQDAIALRNVMRKIHAPTSAPTVNWSVDFRAQSISDAIAISTTALDSGLYRILEAIEDLAVDLLREGYFIRGALVRGQLYHDASMVFGEALVRAYELESTIARFPRVVIGKEVMGDISRKGTGLFSEEKRKFDPFIEQADDGPYYVHVLRKITAEIQSVQLENLNKRPEEQIRLTEYAQIQDVIQKRLDESSYDPRNFEKVQWFAKYWRSFVPYGVADFKTLTGPGMDKAEWTTQG
jgi:hypothetical protein